MSGLLSKYVCFHLLFRVLNWLLHTFYLGFRVGHTGWSVLTPFYPDLETTSSCFPLSSYHYLNLLCYLFGHLVFVISPMSMKVS